MRRDCKRRRMRGDHRRAAGMYCVAHRLGRNVRDVDQHPQIVHRPHDLLAKRRQPVRARNVGRRVDPIERIGVSQGHVPRTEVIQPAQRRERVLDRMSTLDADQRGDFARSMDPLDVIGGEGNLQVVGITSHQPANEIDLFERDLGSLPFAHRFDRGVGGPELRANAPFAEPRQVGIERGLRQGNIELVEAGITLGAQLPGEIVVSVDHQRTAVQFQRRVGQYDGRPLGRGSRRRRGGLIGKRRRPQRRHDQRKTKNADRQKRPRQMLDSTARGTKHPPHSGLQRSGGQVRAGKPRCSETGNKKSPTRCGAWGTLIPRVNSLRQSASTANSAATMKLNFCDRDAGAARPDRQIRSQPVRRSTVREWAASCR